MSYQVIRKVIFRHLGKLLLKDLFYHLVSVLSNSMIYLYRVSQKRGNSWEWEITRHLNKSHPFLVHPVESLCNFRIPVCSGQGWQEAPSDAFRSCHGSLHGWTCLISTISWYIPRFKRFFWPYYLFNAQRTKHKTVT